MNLMADGTGGYTGTLFFIPLNGHDTMGVVVQQVAVLLLRQLDFHGENTSLWRLCRLPVWRRRRIQYDYSRGKREMPYKKAGKKTKICLAALGVA